MFKIPDEIIPLFLKKSSTINIDQIEVENTDVVNPERPSLDENGKELKLSDLPVTDDIESDDLPF